MPVSIIATSYGNSGVTSPAIDSSGADLLLVPLYLCAAAFTTQPDSKGNNYTDLTRRDAGSGYSAYQTYSVGGLVLGSGHTASNSVGYSRVGLIAVAGAHATPLDGESGNRTLAAPTTSIQPGSLTPSEDGCLIVTTITCVGGGTITPPAGFTVIVNESDTCALAYMIQGTAAPINPTWAWPTSVDCACTMTVWKPAAGGGGSTQPPRSMYLNALRRAA